MYNMSYIAIELKKYPDYPDILGVSPNRVNSVVFAKAIFIN